jgi:hypothetical protein
MTNARRAHRCLIVVVMAAACGLVSAQPAPQDDAQAKKMRLTPGKPFVLDFSGSPDGGVSAGSFNNFAFRLSREPVRKLVVRRDELGKEVMATYDYADCTQGQERLLERQIRDLPPGDPTFVDRIDIEMLPFPQKEFKSEGGVCYGFRNPQGEWQWRLSTTPLTYDAGSGRVRARLWVKQANVDAVKLVFDSSMPRQYVTSVTVTTQPADEIAR